MEYLNQGTSRKINSQGMVELTTTIYNRTPPFNTVENHKEPNMSWHHHANIAATILRWQEPFTISHEHRAASKSRPSSINQAKTYHYRLEYKSSKILPLPSRNGQMHRTHYRAIKSHIKPAITIQRQLQISQTVKKRLELAITIMQYLSQRKSPKINPKERPESTTTI